MAAEGEAGEHVKGSSSSKNLDMLLLELESSDSSSVGLVLR